MWAPNLTGRNPVKYLAIVEALAESVEAGDLQPGAQLPTHRELAWRLRVNVSTMTQAYREAARHHLVSSEVGRDSPTGLRASITAPASQRELSLARFPASRPMNRNGAANMT